MPFDTDFTTPPADEGVGSRTARGGLVTMCAHALKSAGGIVATAILARLLTPGDYGLIAMVTVATNFLALFKDMGLSLATIQRASIDAQQVSTLFWVNLAVSGALMVAMMALAPAIAAFFAEPELTMITVVTALGFIVGGLGVQHEALLRRQMRFVLLSAIAFAAMAAGYAVGIGLAWWGYRYWALVAAQLTLLGANTAGVWLACRWRPDRPAFSARVASLLRFGGEVTGYSAINYFARNLDTLLIGRLIGAESLGLYNKALQLGNLPTDQINEPLFSVTIPALSRLAHAPERYRQAYLRIMEKVVMLTMPVAALTIVSADWLVHVVLGPQWSQAAPILAFMGVAGMFAPLMNTGGWLLVTQGRTREMLRWSIINAPIAALPIAIGLAWGPVGVAASYSIARILLANPLLIWFVGRKGPVRTADIYRLLAPFLCSTGIALAACAAFRALVPVRSPLLGIASSALIMGSVALLVLCLLPAGRSALIDVKRSLLLLKRRDPSGVDAPGDSDGPRTTAGRTGSSGAAGSS